MTPPRDHLGEAARIAWGAMPSTAAGPYAEAVEYHLLRVAEQTGHELAHVRSDLACVLSCRPMSPDHAAELLRTLVLGE